MLTITPIPAFSDNYIWLLHRDDSHHAAVVDPGDATPVLQHLQQNQLQLDAILITHYHHDHTGGIASLLAAFPAATVYAPAQETIPHMTQPVGEHDVVTLPSLDAQFWVMDVAGHTKGHIAYYGEGVLFCGDTLFSAGCGRLFEGTAAQMYAALHKIHSLPDETKIYCAHEYTLDNIAFAKWVEPDNTALLAYEAECHVLCDQDKPTLPSRLAIEKQINPFLRLNQPEVIAAAARFRGMPLSDAVAVFAAIREWKDTQFD